MRHTILQPDPTWSLDQLRKHFGMIPGERIVLEPPPGTATEKDAVRLIECKHRVCELVEGVLLEKAMGAKESFIAGIIIQLLNNFLDQNDRGVVLGADGMLRLLPGLIRVPDVSFISWERLPEDDLPDVPDLAPDLAVEVVSKGNTRKEMERKLQEYFEHGSKLVWLVYPRTRTVRVYTDPEHFQTRRQDQELDGGDVLPGLTLPLAKLFTPRHRRK